MAEVRACAGGGGSGRPASVPSAWSALTTRAPDRAVPMWCAPMCHAEGRGLFVCPPALLKDLELGSRVKFDSLVWRLAKMPKSQVDQMLAINIDILDTR